MKKILNEYDETKKMLNTLRGLTSKGKSLNEQYDAETSLVDDKEYEDSNPEAESDIDVVNDVDVRMVSSDNLDLDLSEEQRQEIANLIDSFREQVSQTANFEPGFTFVSGQARLDGIIQEMGIKFVFIAGNESGTYLNSQMLRVDSESLFMIQKLSKFHEQFTASMDTILRERQNN